MTRWTWVLAAVALCTACQDGRKSAPASERATLRPTGGATVEVIPAEGQLPYCMLYSVSEKGVIRQLTLTRENRSIRCDASKPIANTSFRIPVQEGKVRLYIFFSDDRIPAGPVAQQLYEMRNQERISAMDLRLPGKVFVQTLEFTPQEGGGPVVGSVVAPGGVVTSDGGTGGNGNGNTGAPTDAGMAPAAAGDQG